MLPIFLLCGRCVRFHRELTVALFMLVLAGCGGDSNDASPQPVQKASTPSAMKDSAAPAAVAPTPSPRAVPSPNGAAENADKLQNTMQLAQLMRLPYLSALSQEEILEFRNQLRNTSPSQRQALLNNYASLASLPVQQKQRLLDQLAQIVPNTTQYALVTCLCENGLLREMCVQEDCNQNAALSAVCKSVCGTASRPAVGCSPSQQCVEK